jgi:DNA-binding beta-propeller fold protein YncE
MKVRAGKIDIGVIAGLCIGLAIIIGFAAFMLLDTIGKTGSGLGDEYTYDVTKLGKVDESLIIYKEIGEGLKTNFEISQGITIDDASMILYVVGDESVRMFNITSSGAVFEREIILADVPHCIQVSDDKIYVGMKEHVEVYDRAGQRLNAWETLGERAVLTGIDVYKDDVFVADAGNRVVVRYDKQGQIKNYIGKKDLERNIPGFVIPSHNFDLAVADDGLLRVVNPGRHRIEAYTFDGDLEFWWGKASMEIEGFCGCCNPANFTIDTEGNFITSEKGLVRVKVYDSEGEFVGVVASPEQLFRGGAKYAGQVVTESQAPGFDVAVDNEGKVYVLDTIKNIVRVFKRKETVQ